MKVNFKINCLNSSGRSYRISYCTAAAYREIRMRIRSSLPPTVKVDLCGCTAGFMWRRRLPSVSHKATAVLRQVDLICAGYLRFDLMTHTVLCTREASRAGHSLATVCFGGAMRCEAHNIIYQVYCHGVTADFSQTDRPTPLLRPHVRKNFVHPRLWYVEHLRKWP
jgi:hypothetical protein